MIADWELPIGVALTVLSLLCAAAMAWWENRGRPARPVNIEVKS